MQPTDDSLLLRQYAENHSDEAFAALVTRHINLVYSVALRCVGDPHQAEEVAQAVFILLAKKAAQLRHDKALSSWLFQTTRLTASNFIRGETRRHRREQEAHMQSVLNEPANDVWSRIAPLLDDAVAGLNEKDRDAIVLRFYEGRSLREVGAILGASEDAAEKRVSRAVERLREFFAKRGVTVGASGLVVVISANAVQAAPVELTLPLLTAAKAAMAANTNTTSVSTALKWIAWAKAKASIGAAGILLFVGAVAVYESKAPNTAAGKSRLPTGSGVASICMGGGHGIILASDGSLWSWGENYAGWPVLGLGNISTQTTLCRIGTDNDWVNIASSFTHCLAIKSDGTMWGWGQNLNGQLGTGTSGRRNASRSTPVPTATGNDWKQVAAGGAHSLAIKKDGTLWAWGINWAGQLGIGSTNRQVTEITRVGTATNWIKVWAGGVQSIGQQSDGSLWFWGSFTGEESDTNRCFIPTRISPDTNWVDVSFGYFITFAIKNDGTLWAWGRNAGIYTGAPLQLLNPTPNRVGTNQDWRACSSAEYFYRVLQKKDGSLWGLDASDYAFLNKPNHTPVELRPINLKKEVVAFGATGRNMMGVALTRDGEVWTWGKVLGEYTGSPLLQSLADATKWKTDRFQPKPVMRDEPWLLPIQE